MKRRKFLYSTMAAGAALPLTSFANQPTQETKEKELYEIRTYEMKFGASQQVLQSYLSDVLAPSLMRMGATTFKLYGELGNSAPTKIYALISYPNSEVYLKAQNLNNDGKYVTAAAKYNALPPEKTLYNRFSSSLLLAFDGMPKMMEPIDGASLFELRTYEGYSEDAVRRKIKMFNDGEIDIFLKTGLHPVFFGEMIVGPYRPCLTYMLNFKDMDEHDANWKRFSSNSDWESMKTKEEYANTVSNIRKIFLSPL
ncbi:NIPSNAP family protein [Kriegella aquimaris]|uniref:NIPSNAP protein n=1 Tax=Kriegella aquimaris TaxID=192904 RepID=A0A1G9WUE6_9FLAO|nr:NIPSNAP family protein [Kriegella aquimaris]SDM88078.1 NIPSNAP protein [Kriegella aquimaris]